MKFRNAFLALLAAGSVLLGLAGVATGDYGVDAVRAQSDGFDALARQLFNSGGRAAR